MYINKMVLNKFLILSIILCFVLLIIIYILFQNPKLYYPPLPKKFTAKTADFSTLKKITLERVENIKKSSNLFSPYNSRNMDECYNAIGSAKNYGELVSVFRLVPNHSIGIYPIYPIKDIRDTVPFQFEQGVLGWYWGYAVYPKQNDNFGTVMYYILRNDLGTKEIREKYNLSIGSTTVYTVSIGVGIGKGNWYFCPEPIICGGEYIVDNSNFKFSCQTDKLNSFTFEKKDNNLSLNFEYSDGTIKFGTDTIFIKDNKERFNAPNGCAPCISGIGSLYWSYTDLISSSTIMINDKKYDFTNGDGWLDHQWGRSELPLKLVDRLGVNTLEMFKSVGKLGRYIWINLHLPDNTQYMIFCFPNEAKEAEVGDNYVSKYNIYTKNDSQLLKKGSLRFDYITSYQYNNNTIKFPTKLTMIVEDMNGNEHIYKMDTTLYGNCITIDGSGNPHWSGGATLTENDEQKGTAFLELNQFETEENYLENSLKLANMEGGKYKNSKLSFWQILPSLIVILIPILLIISIIVFFVVGIKIN
jgi:hypothetical protein